MPCTSAGHSTVANVGVKAAVVCDPVHAAASAATATRAAACPLPGKMRVTWLMRTSPSA